MSNGNNEGLLCVRDECDVVWKSGQVDAPVATRSQSPEQRVLHNRCTRALDLGTKPDTEANRARLVIACDALDLCGRLREELQNKAHRSGAICRSLAKTSPAGIGFDSPALKWATRRAISDSHAASAPGSGSRSTLSKS